MQMQRLFETVFFLLRRGHATSAELAARFGVSRRTIYRDLDALSAAGVPVYAERGKNGGISLLPGFSIDRSLLTQGEQQQLLTALKGLSGAGAAEAGTALEKLAGLFHSEGADWLEVDLSPWEEEKDGAAVFSMLRDAILRHQCLRFDYCAASGACTGRVAEPVRLVFKDSFWYLQAWCRARRAMRTFKVSRMLDITPTGEHFTPGPQHHPLPLECAASDTPLVRLSLRFSPRAGGRLYDFFSPSQVNPQPDGSFLVCVAFPEDEWIYSFLLGFGADVEVLSPAGMRRVLAQRGREIAQLYAEMH